MDVDVGEHECVSACVWCVQSGGMQYLCARLQQEQQLRMHVEIRT